MASLKVISATLSTPPRQRLKLQTTQLISFDGKYVSGEALEVLTSTTENKYIIKGSTGIGGTTAILNYQKGNYIIISPNVGMIKGKKTKDDDLYKSDKQLFIYSNSINTWQEVSNYLDNSQSQNLIINTTPDQILKIYDSPIYMKLIDIPIFIDEVHAYSQDASFRDSMGAFMELVYNDWKACFTLSTASPIYNFWDIPTNVEIDYYKLIRKEQTTKQLSISYDRKAVQQFVCEQNEKGNLVVIFSNNKNVHTSFKELKVANLVGETLRLKLAPNKRGMLIDNINYDSIDVLILSSSYFAGFDIEKDCSILIINDQNNDAWKVNVNNIIQCYGRCRTIVNEALFVNICNRNSEHKVTKEVLIKGKKNYEDTVSQIQNLEDKSLWQYFKKSGFVTKEGYTNRLKLMEDLLTKIDDYHLYNKEVLIQTLQDNGFVISDYKAEITKLYDTIGTSFSEQIRNLISFGGDKLLMDYYNIKNKLKNKDDGTFSPKLALKYLTAYLITQTNATSLTDKLNNNRVYAGEFYKSVNLFLCVNGSTKYHINKLSKKQLNASEIYFDQEISNVLNTKSKLTDEWQMLYTIHQISNNQFPEKVARGLVIQEVFNNEELYLEYKDSGKNKFSNLKNAILKELKEVTLDANEIDRLNKTIKDNYNKLSENKSIAKYNSNRYLKKIMVQAIIFCLTNGKCGKGKRVGFREYNPLTALPNALRSIIPIKFVEVDLTEANPQFIDTILKTNLAQSVYKNIMQKRKVTRYEAKQIFNSTINNHRLTSNDAIKVYKDAGYSASKSDELAALTTSVEKGSFFKLMTEAESELIHAYNSTIDGVGMRFHDALVFKASDIIDNNIVLPTNITVNKQDEGGFTDGAIDSSAYLRVHFHVGYYNAPELKYEGFITCKEYNSELLTLPKRAS